MELSPLARLASSAATGASGRVYLREIGPDEPSPLPAGVYAVPGLARPATVAVLVPFRYKLGAWMGSYEVGYWPAERHRVSSAAYANPGGFIEVTPETQDVWVSAHFRLRDFVSHDQPNVWPKMVVLREALLDKLELVLADLERRGIPASHAVILSGFRTPAHNLALGDASGRARESRHQYGDAVDLIIDANHDGRMDDLNGDGRVNAADVRVIEAAVNRVERAHPELAGGLGVYAAEGPSGPFAHIDVRGWTARWDRTGSRVPMMLASTPNWSKRLGTRVWNDVDGKIVVQQASGGTCAAPPDLIRLCRR